MSSFASFIGILHSKCDKPELFSLLHIISLTIVIAICVLTVIFNKKITTKKSFKYIIFGVFCLLIIFEIFKQIFAMLHIKENKIIFYYEWWAFPFHFCSYIYYLLPFVIFLPECKIKNRIQLFSAIFILFGGLIGILVPSFSNYIFINIQTIVHHGMMVIVGLYIAINSKEEFTFRNYIETTPIFFILLSIALFLNWIIPEYAPNAVKVDLFNLFFVSWRIPSTLPILSDVWKAVPYPVYLLLYILGFLFVSFLIYCIFSLIFFHKISFKLKRAD